MPYCSEIRTGWIQAVMNNMIAVFLYIANKWNFDLSFLFIPSLCTILAEGVGKKVSLIHLLSA